MKAFPYYPHYVKDWLVGTGGMTLSERGLYITLLNIAWDNGARLPDDPAELRRWSGVDRQQWGRIWPRVRHHWTLSEPDENGKRWWTNKRLSAEWAKLLARGERARANGSKGGRPKKEDAKAPENVAPRTGRKTDANGLKNVARSDPKPLESNEPEKPVGFSRLSSGKTIQNQIQIDSEESIPPNPPRGERRGGNVIQWSFEKFWDAWPEKKGEAAAKRAFMFLQSDVGSQITEEDLIEAVYRYSKNPGTSRYMGAAKWLSGHHFKDAPPVLPPGAEQTKARKGGLSNLKNKVEEWNNGNGDHTRQRQGLVDIAAEGNGKVIEGEIVDPQKQVANGRAAGLPS